MDTTREEAIGVPAVLDLKGQDLTKPLPKVKSELPEYWDRAYINERLNHVTDPKAQMLITALWRSGIRITEAISLRDQDLFFPEYMMKVRWRKSRKYLYRMVPMHPTLKDVLQLYTAGLKAEDLVFRFTRQRAWQLIQQLLQGNLHKLRHSFAVNWLKCGGDIVTLSRILGHSDLKVTMIYLQIVPVDQRKRAPESALRLNPPLEIKDRYLPNLRRKSIQTRCMRHTRGSSRL